MIKEEIFEVIKSRIGDVVVIYRPVGGIGDGVMILPAITALRIQNPNSLIIILCIDYIEVVFEHNNVVDHIISYTEGELNDRDDIQDLTILKKLGCIIHFLHHPCPAAEYESLACPGIYKSRQAIFAEACGVEFDRDYYNFVLHDDELEAPVLMDLPERYVVVQLRSHDRWRNYRYNKWLLYNLVATGKKFDFGVVTIDANQWYDIKGVRGIYQTPMPFIFGVLAKALLVIGPDSSFPHVAGAMGIPVLGLFGPTNPIVRLHYEHAYWMPRYSKCARQWCWYHPCEHRFCMTYKPREIVDKAVQIIQRFDNVQKKT